MRILSIITLALLVALAATPAGAAGATLYVDDDGLCGNKSPCYVHPQDAVNDANPGDTIRVYPGHYISRQYTAIPPHYSLNDQFAPPLIVYKDGLTIRAVDNNPANTVIHATHAVWSNPVAIQASTGGIWNGAQYIDAGVNPTFGSAPNAISIIANGVTIDGFTVRRSDAPNAGGHDAILIGGLYAGYGMHGETLGFGGNTVRNCVIDGGGGPARSGVWVWHSTDNLITRNTIVDPLAAAIALYDGYSDAEVGLAPTSTGNRIQGNTVIDDPATWGMGQGVFVGAWNTEGPLGAWTNNAGTRVTANDLGGLAVVTGYSWGDKRFAGNRNVSQYQAFFADDYFFPPEGGPPMSAQQREMLVGRMSALRLGPPPGYVVPAP